MKYHVTHEQIHGMVAEMASIIPEHVERPYEKLNIYPVPRGGVPVAYHLLQHFTKARIVQDPNDADVIVDDLIDSGATANKYIDLYPDTPFLTLLDKRHQYKQAWIVFPWEHSEAQSAEDIPRRLLQYIGEDPARGGLQETPQRYLNAWKHWTSGYTCHPSDVLKVFEDGAEKCDEMVLVRDIPVYSQCEHHLAPFFGVAHIAYIPNGKIVGLSKLSRLADIFARRLQVQERLTNQVADALNEYLDPLGVGVVIKCRHLCMESRGICQQGHSTITSAMRGAFREQDATRAEFMGLVS
jgi:GTP cyclohydrolase I